MALSRRTGRSRLTLVLLIITSVTLLTLDYRSDGGGIIGTVRDGARTVFTPFRSAADAVVAPIGDVVGGIIHYGDLEAENDRLRAELAEARGQAVASAEAERERQALLDLLGLDAAADVPAVAARVIGRELSNFELTAEIDRGSDHGVGVGMPVVTGEGLVGRVVRVSSTRSVVLLVTDASFDVGVRLTGTGDVGVASGGGRDASMSVDYIDRATEIADGELVVTSGLEESAFPAGIPVGTVTESESPDGALQAQVRLEPVADIDRLSFVRVLQWVPSS